MSLRDPVFAQFSAGALNFHSTTYPVSRFIFDSATFVIATKVSMSPCPIQSISIIPGNHLSVVADIALPILDIIMQNPIDCKPKMLLWPPIRSQVPHNRCAVIPGLCYTEIASKQYGQDNP